MPSYADEYAARHPEHQGASAGPVRLTISRGDSVVGPDGRFSYLEKWEEEEIMDVEVVSSVDTEAASSQLREQGPEDRLVDTVRERLIAGRQKGARFQSCSLLVLDTNTLLSALPFLMTLFSQCLSRNVFALSHPTFSASPIALVIPHTVLSELDHLKTSLKRNVGPLARSANNWILSALQMQKRQMFDDVRQSVVHRERIPERSWVLHVENTAHASARGSLSSVTPDEEIVRLCVTLQKDAGFDTFFCSDDTNARTRAEVEGLATISFAELVKSNCEKEGSDEYNGEMVQIATDFIEQWQAQVDGIGEEQDRMEEDEHVSQSARQPPTGIQGKTTQHSTHAVQTTSNHQTASSKTARFKTSHHSRPHTGPKNMNNYIHQYPNDRSTSSSMWAN